MVPRAVRGCRSPLRGCPQACDDMLLTISLAAAANAAAGVAASPSIIEPALPDGAHGAQRASGAPTHTEASPLAGGQALPFWTAPPGDASKTPGLAGYEKIKAEFNTAVFYGSKKDGWYNHAAMMTLFNDTIAVSWKNAPESEDTPGQRVLWSATADPREWPRYKVLFPNMSTLATPVAQFAGPFAVIARRLYASASPAIIADGDAQGAQFCLWPDGLDPRNCATPDNPGTQPKGLLMLRRILDVRSMEAGPVFWASSHPPPELEAAARANGVLALSETDAVTRADVATLSPTMPEPPCDTAHGTLKCEGCAGGCHLYDSIKAGLGIANERTHYPVPAAGAHRGVSDVIFYRSHADALFASTRADGRTQGNWSKIMLTTVPNDNSNINAGVLPGDAGVFLVSNAVPAHVRDPITLAISRDGFNFSSCRVLQTCTDFPDVPTSKCGARFKKNGNVGPSYPQALTVVAPAPEALRGLYVVSTNNKEDVVITKAAWSSVLPPGARL